MTDIIFEQDKELQRPYTAKALLNRAKDPRLVYPLPKVNPGNWLCNLLRRQRMTRAQIIEKVAADLWLTLEKRDGIFVFRFPDIWDTDDVQDMQRTVLDGIAMLEAQRSLIVWLRDFFENFSAGMARLWESMITPIAMTLFGVSLLLGTIYTFSVGAAGWGIAVFFVALSGCSVRISVNHTEDAEPDIENAFPLGRSHLVDPKRIIPTGLGSDVPNGGQSNSALLTLMKSLETKLLREEPLKTDDIYEEPQATYPMEMRI